jgi:hypothetical protein
MAGATDGNALAQFSLERCDPGSISCGDRQSKVLGLGVDVMEVNQTSIGQTAADTGNHCPDPAQKYLDFSPAPD